MYGLINLKLLVLLFWLKRKTTEVTVNPLRINPLIRIVIPKPSANSTRR